MPEAEAAPEAPPPPPPAPKSLFSPAGYVVIGVVMIVEALVVYFLAASLGKEALEPPPIKQDYVQVDLNAIERDVLKDRDDLGFAREKFQAEVSLVLNPAYGGDLVTITEAVVKRKDLLTHIILTEIVNKKNNEEFYKPNFDVNLAREIRQRLNQELGYKEGGAEIIEKVIYRRLVLPGRK